jgi:hypothetical protein
VKKMTDHAEINRVLKDMPSNEAQAACREAFEVAAREVPIDRIAPPNIGKGGWRELAFRPCGLMNDMDWWEVVFPLDEIVEDG